MTDISNVKIDCNVKYKLNLFIFYQNYCYNVKNGLALPFIKVDFILFVRLFYSNYVRVF